MMTLQCARCGKSFQPKDQSAAHLKRNPPRYCSRACGQPNQPARQMVPCSECGRSFQRKRYHVLMSGERGQFCGFRCYAQWQARNMQGPANPGYRASAHRLLTCDWCSRQFSRPKWVRGGLLTFCSRPCFQSFAAEHWRRLRPVGYGKSWRRAKKLAMERDQHRCQDCGSTAQLVVHHLREYRTFERGIDAHAQDNLVTLCRACHLVRHSHNWPNHP